MSQRLADIRDEADIKPAAKAAKKAGCSRIYYLQLEEGRVGLSERLQKRLAAIYGVEERAVYLAWRRGRIAYLENELAKLRKNHA